MITEQEHILIEKLRGTLKKSELQQLLDIKNRETGENYNTCFCSSKVRSRYNKEFYAWYDNNNQIHKK